MEKVYRPAEITEFKMPAGRPTKYDTKYCDEIVEYFDVEKTKIVIEKHILKNGDEREIEKEVANDLPTFQGFAGKIGVHTDTLQEWKKVHPEFSVAYKKAQCKQEDIWLSNSIKGLYPGAFTIFAGKNMFGWRDKREMDIKHDASESLLDAIMRRREDKKDGAEGDK